MGKVIFSPVLQFWCFAGSSLISSGLLTQEKVPLGGWGSCWGSRAALALGDPRDLQLRVCRQSKTDSCHHRGSSLSVISVLFHTTEQSSSKYTLHSRFDFDRFKTTLLVSPTKTALQEIRCISPWPLAPWAFFFFFFFKDLQILDLTS